MALSCVKTMLFGEVCDACDGGAIFKLVAFGLKLLSAGVLVAATIGIIICGVIILTARDDASKLAKAKRRLLDIVIGIVVYVLMFSIINFILPGGVVESSLDSSTTSCPEAKLPESTTGDHGQDGDGDGDGDGDQDGDGDEDGDGTPDEQIPADALTGVKAKYFLSNPISSCPKNTKHKDAGKTIDYTSGELAGYSVVNTPIDVIKYRDYLAANHIAMDSKTCTTDGSDCKGGSYYNDDGNCEKFSPVFAGNLYGNMCVSNDAFASHMGVTNKQMFFQSIWLEHGREPGSGQGNDVPSRVNKKYFDPNLHFDSNEKSAGVYPGWGGNESNKCNYSKRILAEVVGNGNPVVMRVHNNGHSTVVVGVKTSIKEAYLNKTGGCSDGTPQLGGTEILYLNTDGKFWTNLYIGNPGNITTHCGQQFCDN